MTLPDELVGCRIDGASPMRFFTDIVLPRSQNQSGGAVHDRLYLQLRIVFVAVVDYADVDLGTTVAGSKDDRFLTRHHGMELSDGGDVNAYHSGGDCFGDTSVLRAQAWSIVRNKDGRTGNLKNGKLGW